MAFIKAYCVGIVSIREERDAQITIALRPILYVPHHQTTDALATVACVGCNPYCAGCLVIVAGCYFFTTYPVWRNVLLLFRLRLL